MNKRQLIEDIRKFNRSAETRFLAQFDESALKQYLDHLENTQQHHPRISGWARKESKRLLVC